MYAADYPACVCVFAHFIMGCDYQVAMAYAYPNMLRLNIFREPLRILYYVRRVRRVFWKPST